MVIKLSERIFIQFLGWLIIIGLLYGTMEFLSLIVLKTQIFENPYRVTFDDAVCLLNDKQRDTIRAHLSDANKNSRIHDDLGWWHPIRSEVQHVHEKESGVVRIAAFGDSFTYGAEVHIDEAWPTVLAGMLPGVEVLNFGVGGYGLDQAYLRYQIEGKDFAPDVVIIGFIIENADRNVSAFRPLKLRNTLLPYTKPRFVLENEELRLIPNPLKLHDYQRLLDAKCTCVSSSGIRNCGHRSAITRLFMYLPSIQLASLLQKETAFLYATEAEQDKKFHLTAQLFSRFYSEAQGQGAFPVILLMPTRADFNQSSTLMPYESFFVEHGMRFLNTTYALRQHPFSELFSRNGHYSPLGNDIVARALSQYLQQEDILSH